jgi:hypothetical protein
MSRKIIVVGCGGFGTEIVAQLLGTELYDANKEHIEVLAIDTSDSNLKRHQGIKNFGDIKLLMTQGTDGGGKKRAENIEAITNLATESVQNGTFDTDGLIILISSATGASGAVANSELQAQLTARKKSVISMVLEVDDTIQDVENAILDLRTRQFKASQGTRNFNVYSGSNRRKDGTVNQRAADREFLLNLMDFIAAGHPDNQKIDSQDLNTFLNWSGQKDVPGVVRFLSIIAFTTSDTFVKGENTEGRGVRDLSGFSVPTAALSLLTSAEFDPQVIPGTGSGFQGIVAPGLNLGEGIEEVQFQTYSGRSAQKLQELNNQLALYKKVAEKASADSAGDTFVPVKGDQPNETGTFV